MCVCVFQYGKGELKFSSLTFDDSGMYQCLAENYWGIKYANAELRVIGKSVVFLGLKSAGKLAVKTNCLLVDSNINTLLREDIMKVGTTMTIISLQRVLPHSSLNL